MKVIIELDNEDLEKKVQKIITEELKKMGLIRFIRESIHAVFKSWQKTHTPLQTQLNRINQRISTLKRK